MGIVDDAERIASSAWDWEPSGCNAAGSLPYNMHLCGYDLGDGRRCGHFVNDKYRYCYWHAVAAGHVRNPHRCTDVRKNGERCRRPVRREGDRCWQHRPGKAAEGAG